MNQQEGKENIVNLISLKPGEKGVFKGINKHGCELGPFHGHRGRWFHGKRFIPHHGIPFHTGLLQRLEAMGIRPGVTITKVSDHFFHGPVIIEAGRTQLAIGYGMAVRMLVDTGKENHEENTTNGKS